MAISDARMNQPAKPARGTLRLLLALVASFAFVLSAGAGIPRPEHPRPEAYRTNWTSLNGEWQFEIDAKADGETRGLMSGKELQAKILVPFCPESKLSGVGHYEVMKHTWYRRTFEVPAAMKDQRVRLHFGAVDYQAWVWVNGQPVGSHIGGSPSFSFEITRCLREGSNELVVHVFDDTASGKEPAGKQTPTVSEGCLYTRTTGIWQPVWLEAVGASFVKDFSLTPDPDHSRVLLSATVDEPAPGLKLTAEAFASGKRVGTVTGEATARQVNLVLKLSQKQLWEPGAPFLYDLKFTLSRGKEKVDEVASYFGLRKVSVEGRAVLINGKRVFQRLILDQGFYPDGIWTAPSDEELRRDIERSMAAGYNGARLHQKVFEPRFLYWADKLGYLVWGEFPNWGFNYRPENYANYSNEWAEVVVRDRNHPAIIGWCPFNETPPAAGELQQLVWNQTRALDPTRPVIESSGWVHTLKNPQILDEHDYNQDPAAFKQGWADFFRPSSASSMPARYGPSRVDRGVPFMVSEFGGTFWGDKQGWGYGSGPKDEEGFYKRYEGLVSALLDNPNMFGFCYTQLTDVEQEHNGLYFYDRRPKFDLKRLHAITARPAAYEQTGPVAPAPAGVNGSQWRVLVGAAADGELCQPYHYTTQAPADDWTAESFDDHAWRTAQAPFGNALPGVRTAWKNSDIWLRRTFNADRAELKNAALVIFYDEDTEVYVNGQKLWNRTGYLSSYQMFPITDALKKALKKGQNTLAVHTRQTGGGQFIDLAVLCEP
jgi:hypothetical protein